MKHILTPVDGSETSLRAVEFASGLARGLGARLTILAVRQHIAGRKVVAAEWTQEEVTGILGKALETANREGLKDAAIVDVKSRDVAHAIVEYSELNAVDLIVMGASGMGSVKAFVIGSVSADVLRKSLCPVTVVH